MIPHRNEALPTKELLLYEGLLLVQFFLWGSGNPVGKIGLQIFSPFYMLAMRFNLALLFFLLFSGRHLSRVFKKEDLLPCLIVSVYTAISFATGIIALAYTTAIRVGFILSIAVVFVPFLSRIILGTVIQRRILVYILIVVVGLYFFCEVDGVLLVGFGEFLTFIAALSGACMLVYSEKYLKNIDPMVVATTQTAFTGISCLLIAFVVEDFPDVPAISTSGWSAILYMAVFCTCIPYTIQNKALVRVPAIIVALLCTTEPIFTAIISYFMLGETLSASGFIGAALIIVGVAAASLLPSTKVSA